MTEDEMVGWHHQLNGHESEQGPGDGEEQGSLVWVWGLPRCVWARESTAPAQGNQSLSRDAALCPSG